MPRIVADIVDAYIFRKVNARVQFLLLLRRADAALGNTWQSIHEKIEPGETALEAAERAVLGSTGLTVTEAYSADYINQVYDHLRDTIILVPVFAFAVPPRAQVRLSEDFGDSLDRRRFRANIYMDSASGRGFGENEFVGRSLRIGSKAVVSVLERDPRCKMISLDPDTGEHSPQVLRTVARVHGNLVGVYCAVLVEGIVRKGDSVELVD